MLGIVGKNTENLSFDFLKEYRRFVHKRRYSLDKYEFAVINTDDKEVFRFLTSYYLGVFDTPGIFVI